MAAKFESLETKSPKVKSLKIEFLVEEMMNPDYSIERLLAPRDREGKVLDFRILDVDENGNEIWRNKTQKELGASIQSGHLFERIAEILIFYGVSPLGRVEQLKGKIAEIEQVSSLKDYLKQNINAGSSGGVSDITFKKGNDTYVSTCKFFKKERSTKKYDILDLVGVAGKYKNKYKDFEPIYLVFVKNKIEFLLKWKGARSEVHKKIVEKYIKDENIFDKSDLDKWLSKFRSMDHSKFEWKSEKEYLSLHLHQEIISRQVINDIKETKEKYYGIFAVPRSGKMYIAAGIIDKYAKELSIRSILIKVLFLTSRPNETKNSILDIMKSKDQFKEFHVEELNSSSSEPTIVKQTFHFSSKQRYNEKKVLEESKIKYDLIIFDEVHEGGTTKLSKETLNKFSDVNSKIILMTATYNKPLVKFSINSKCCYYWDLDDISAMKKKDLTSLDRFSITSSLFSDCKNNKDKLDISQKITGEDIVEYYKSFPMLIYFTNQFKSGDTYKQIFNKFNTNEIGFDMKGLFKLNDDQTQLENPQDIKKFLSCFTGNGEHKDSRRDSILPRIKQHMAEKGDGNSFIGMIWFLPFGEGLHIKNLTCILKKFLLKDRVLKGYEIVDVNDDIKTENLSKSLINRADEAKNGGKVGIILLCGMKCALGISLPFINISCIFNHLSQSDIIFQMSFRSMTESFKSKAFGNEVSEKKHGFVVDMNPDRILSSIISMNRKSENKDAFLRRIIGNVIDIDPDYFRQDFKSGNEVIKSFKNLWMGRSTDPSKYFKSCPPLEIPSDFSFGKSKSVIKNKKEKTIKNLGIETKRKDSAESKEEKKDEMDEEDDEIELDELDEDKRQEYIQKLVTTVLNIGVFLYHNFRRLVIDYTMEKIAICVMNDHNLKDIELKMNDSIGKKDIRIESVLKMIFNNKNILQEYIYQMAEEITDEVEESKEGKDINQDIVTIHDNKKKLLKYISNNLIPRELEKKENGEVLTPVEVIEEMLDLLEEEYPGIFTDEKLKWLDPCVGVGNFIICLYYRLMKGLKIEFPDIKERKKHILEEMIYVCELNPYNIKMYEKIMESEEYKLNIFVGDFIKDHEEDEFDIVIGNPPYQVGSKDGKMGSSSPFYNKFIEKGLKIGKRVYMVTPSRWFGGGGKGLDKFRKNMMSCGKIKMIKHFNNSKDIFKHVDIRGGVNYILVDQDHDGECKLNGTFIDLSKLDIIVNELDCIPFISKMINYESISDMFRTRNYYKIETNDKRVIYDDDDDEDNDDNKELLLCYVSLKKRKDRIGYIDKDEIEMEFTDKKGNEINRNHWKVVTARTGAQGFGVIFVSKPNEVYNNSYISFKVEDEDEAKSLKSYLECKLPIMLMVLRKPTQDISEKTIRWIPKVPFDRVWTDQQVYEHFELSEDEIKLVEDYCKKYKIKCITINNVEEKKEKKAKNVKKKEEKKSVKSDKTIKNVNSKMTNDQLKAECKARGLKGYSRLKKAELIELLNEND